MGGTAPEAGLDGLTAEQEQVQLALEAGEIGIWDWDLVAGRMTGSAQMHRNLGLSPDAGDDLYPLLVAAIHPEERGGFVGQLEEFRARVGPMRIEARLAREPDQWIVFLGRVVADAAGAPAKMLGITIDSTRRRRMQEQAAYALRDSDRRLREMNRELERLARDHSSQLLASRALIQAMFDNSPDWLTVFRATPDGRFVYQDLNRATEQGYGLPRDQVIGRPLQEILGLEQAQVPLAHMRECVRTGENQRYTARRVMPGGTRIVDVMFVRVPEKHDGDHILIATARDITEREAIEERLRQSQKMEAVGQLTGGLAHDFNNLLTAIIGNLELLGARVGNDRNAANHVAAAQRAAENGARLTEQLLAFSRRQHLQPRAVDLNAVIAGMQDLLARTIGPAIEVRTVLSPLLWPALVDPTQIEIAILNLAINARDAMPLGGNMTIETRNLQPGLDPAPRDIGDRECICISVRDTGTGMTEDVLRSAVEPFFTTKEVGKGSGLGLSQVYGMVQQSNGAMQIDSRPGAGTAVHLYVPRAAAGIEMAGEQRGRAGRGGNSGRVLVVDDDAAVREVTVEMLREAGYGVAEVDSGNAALAALQRGETYDLVVIDIAMPGFSGIETVARAREMMPGLRVLYVTGYADPGGIESPTGGDPLIKKPFRFAELVAEVKKAIERPHSPAAAPNVVPLLRRE